MRISQGGFDALVSHENLDSSQRDTGHHQPTRKRVPQIVPAEIWHLGFFDDICEPVPPVSLAWTLVTGATVSYAEAPLLLGPGHNVAFSWAAEL